MANTLLTIDQITREALAILHNKLTFLPKINRQYDKQYAKSGAKIGSTLRIREPNQFTVRTGDVMNTQDVTETSQSLVMATKKGVDFALSSTELTLSLNDFSAQILNPAMARLAADIEVTVLDSVYQSVYNLVGTPGTTPATLLTALNAGTKLTQGLAPKDGNRYLLYNSLAMGATINALSGLFQSANAIKEQYEKGVMGYVAGLEWLESEIIPVLTNGTRDDTTPVVNTSTGITSGTATIAITAEDTSATIKAGEVFTVAGVFAVNPETKAAYSHLQQFVVTADATASGGAVTVSVSPTPITSGAKQNVSIVSAGSGKAVVHVAAGGSGAASTSYPQHMVFHKDAFTFVSADLPLYEGGVAHREVYDGISLRVWKQGDIINDKFLWRTDVLFGYKAVRPEWACRVTG